MRFVSGAAVIPAGMALVLLAWVGCGGASESDEAEGDEAEVQMEDITPGMATEGDEGEGGEGEGGEGEHGEGGAEGEGGEHDEGGEHGEEGEGGGEGEEGGDYIGRDESWDATRRGIRLTLSYDAERDAFVGMVENSTDATVCAVRVEVHLSGGTELGPTDRLDLAAGGTGEVVLSAEGEDFESWTAHPETSACG